MRAIVYIAHGSRAAISNELAAKVCRKVMGKVQSPLQHMCFLELAEPSIEEAVDICAERGATSIVFVPLFLLEAHHVRRDIPQALTSCQSKYPHISFSQTKPLGVHEKMIELVHERIEEQSSHPDTTAVLLVGRGSSDERQTKAVREIAARLQETYQYQTVDICFLAAAHPTLEEGIRKIKDNQQAVIMPYLLFPGLLQHKLDRLGSSLQLPVCQPLGGHSLLEEVLIERIEETVREGVSV